MFAVDLNRRRIVFGRWIDHHRAWIDEAFDMYCGPDAGYCREADVLYDSRVYFAPRAFREFLNKWELPSLPQPRRQDELKQIVEDFKKQFLIWFVPVLRDRDGDDAIKRRILGFCDLPEWSGETKDGPSDLDTNCWECNKPADFNVIRVWEEGRKQKRLACRKCLTDMNHNVTPFVP